jgi:hypothetical protein
MHGITLVQTANTSVGSPGAVRQTSRGHAGSQAAWDPASCHRARQCAAEGRWCSTCGDAPTLHRIKW